VAGFTIKITSADSAFVSQSLASMPKRIPQAMAAAINKTVARVRTSIADGIKDATTIKSVRRILKGTHVSKASPSRLTARVTFQGREIGAIQFKHSATKRRGVKVTFMKGDSPQHYRHGFKRAGLGGNVHLFERGKALNKKKANAKGIAHRLPLSTFYGPNLQTIYERAPQIERDANKLANEIIRKELESQVNRFLGRKK
jgi:hypothetical protein